MADGMQSSPHEKDVIAIDDGEHGAKPQKPSKKRKLMLLTLAGIVGKVAVAGAVHWYFTGAHVVSTDNAYVGASTAQINAQVSGQLLEVRAEDTQGVKKGDVLAVIDPTDARLAYNRAEADYRRTIQRVRQYYAQEGSAAAQLRARRADLDRAAADYRRRQALGTTGAISAEELSATRAAYDAANANVSAAEETLASQRALTDGASVLNHPETVAARAALETARLNLERTTIVAPLDGVVAQRDAQVGQRIEVGQPLMVVTPIAQAYVDANFKEGQLKRVRIGQPVKLTSDLYGHDVVYHGRVTGLGGGTGSAFAVIPAQNATGNWIKVVQRVPVRISLDARELSAHPLRVGLSMEAKIDVRRNEH